MAANAGFRTRAEPAQPDRCWKCGLGCTWVGRRSHRATFEGGWHLCPVDGGLRTWFQGGGWVRRFTEPLRASAGQTRDRLAQPSGSVRRLHQPGPHGGPCGVGALVSGLLGRGIVPRLAVPPLTSSPINPFHRGAQEGTRGGHSTANLFYSLP